MANERWYVLKVRSGFGPLVTQRLRKLNLEVIVPGAKTIAFQEPRPFSDYVYCRFGPENRQTVTCIPGVVGILGTPDPASIQRDSPTVQSVTRFPL